MSGMNVNSIGIRKTLKVDTSILPVKYQANTSDSTPVEVMRFNLNNPDSKLVTIQANAREIGSDSDKASFIFTQRIERNIAGNSLVNERVDNHTFRTDSSLNAYIESLNPSQIFSSWEVALDLGPQHIRAFTVNPLDQTYTVAVAFRSTLDPLYATTFLTETDVFNFLQGNPSPVAGYGGQNNAGIGSTDVHFDALANGNDLRSSAFIVDVLTNTIVKKIGDVVTSGGVITFFPSDNFASSGPNHALFVKGLNATNLLWTLTVGQV